MSPNISSSRVATTKNSKCNAMPLVRAGPDFQHKSWTKEEGDPGRNFHYRKDAPVKAIKLKNKIVL